MSNTIGNIIPRQGATSMPSRFANEGKRYVFQAYPSTRYHPDGRVVVVKDADDDERLCPEAEGWGRSPFPPKKPEPVKPEPTPAYINGQLAEFELLKERHAKLTDFCLQQTAELLELRAKVAAPKSDPPPAAEVAASEPAAKTKKAKAETKPEAAKTDDPKPEPAKAE